MSKNQNNSESIVPNNIKRERQKKYAEKNPAVAVLVSAEAYLYMDAIRKERYCTINSVARQILENAIKLQLSTENK